MFLCEERVEDKMQVKRISRMIIIAILLFITVTGCSQKDKDSSGEIVGDVTNETNEEADITEPPASVTESEENNEAESDTKPGVENQENAESGEKESETSVTDQNEISQDNRSELVKITKAEVIQAETMQKKVLKRIQKKAVKTVYTKKYQKAANYILEQYKKKQKYTLKEPLWIMNPYGTIENGLYLYYTSSEACKVSYTVSVDNEAMQDFHAQLYTSDEEAGKEHEGIIIGLIPGVKNYVTLTETNEENEIIKNKVFCINLEKMPVDQQMIFTDKNKLDTEDLKEGFYVLLSNQSSDTGYLQFIDSSGVKRLKIAVDKAVNMEVEAFGEYLVYPKDSKTFAVMNRLGKAEYIYSLGDFIYENSMTYDENTGYIYMIASDPSRESREDLVLSMNLANGEVKVVMDFVETMPEIYEDFLDNAKTVEEDTREVSTEETGTSEPNTGEEDNGETNIGDADSTIRWLELNSLDFLEDNQLVVSSKALSSVICLTNLHEKTKIDYIVSDQSIWQDSSLSNLLYQSIGSFEPFMEQSSIQIFTDDKRLIEGQYYIIMYNGKNGCYKIFVDENTKTFTLAEVIEFNAPEENGSVHMYQSHLIYMVNEDNVTGDFGEYNQDGELLASYRIEEEAGIYHKVKKINAF